MLLSCMLLFSEKLCVHSPHRVFEVPFFILILGPIYRVSCGGSNGMSAPGKKLYRLRRLKSIQALIDNLESYTEHFLRIRT